MSFAYPNGNRIAIFFVLKATRASAGGGHRLAGNRPHHQVLGRSGEKAAWMDRASKGSGTPAWDGEEGDQPGLASPGPSTS
ncbi:hypothetical protein E5288_WYG022175 [Bos mutus]|uniref:Uncharacterized protein n=1 Tax=Bos mutus TaxID=72004 RepID=A0A6B0RHR3_9CETA|nr:hypothetical protein [Bos mutus]